MNATSAPKLVGLKFLLALDTGPKTSVVSPATALMQLPSWNVRIIRASIPCDMRFEKALRNLKDFYITGYTPHSPLLHPMFDTCINKLYLYRRTNRRKQMLTFLYDNLWWVIGGIAIMIVWSLVPYRINFLFLASTAVRRMQ